MSVYQLLKKDYPDGSDIKFQIYDGTKFNVHKAKVIKVRRNGTVDVKMADGRAINIGPTTILM